MSRCSNYICNLPTELLTQVFDYLGHKDYLKSMLVCTRWYEILSDHRYMVHQRLRLKPELLNEENFNNLKRFRSVAIRSDHFAEANHQQRLQQYLFNSEAVELLEELTIELKLTIWNNIFGTEGELNLPNLHTLHISVPILSCVIAQIRCRIVAPKLKTFYQDCTINILEPLDLFNNQIETLVANCRYNGLFYLRTLGLPFLNLRSLTLKEGFERWFSDTDLHSEFKAVFNRLTHLKIHDTMISLSSYLIKEAKNLTSLELYGYSMSNSALSQINQLKQLRELVLMIRIEGAHTGLSLPNLAKLTTFADSLAPLDSVPSLRSLTIANNEQFFEGINFYLSDFVKAQFRVIADQLESLKIIKVYLDSFTINQICTLVNLKSLKLIKVEAETPGILKLLRSLKNLKYIRFTDCSLADHIVYCQDDSDCGCDRCLENYNGFDSEPDEPETEQYGRFFAKLAREKNVDCSLVAEGGRVANSFLSELCSLRKNDEVLKFYSPSPPQYTPRSFYDRF